MVREIRIYIDDSAWMQWRIICLQYGGSRKALMHLMEKENSPVVIKPRLQ